MDRPGEIARLCRAFDVLAAYVFGSRADEVVRRVSGAPDLRGGPESDVDLAVKVEPGRVLSVLEKVQLAQAFENLRARNPDGPKDYPHFVFNHKGR